jgi:hypothetical protein
MAYVFLETQSVVLEMSLQPMVATQFYQVESYVAELTLQKDNSPERMKLHLDPQINLTPLFVSNAKRLNNSSTYVSQGDLFFAN